MFNIQDYTESNLQREIIFTLEQKLEISSFIISTPFLGKKKFWSTLFCVTSHTHIHWI